MTSVGPLGNLEGRSCSCIYAPLEPKLTLEVETPHLGDAQSLNHSTFHVSHLPDYLPKNERSLDDSDLGSDLVPKPLAFRGRW